MKTKIAFLLGAVLGYVLGARAGTKRYEQIKSGVQKLWHSAPVQRGVGAAQGYAQDRTNKVVSAAFDAGKNYFTKGGSASKTQESAAESTTSAAPNRSDDNA